MNNTRRKQLKTWTNKANQLKDELDSILLDEQDYYDNIPENLQGSQRASDSEEAMAKIEEAMDIIDEAIEVIDEIV